MDQETAAQVLATQEAYDRLVAQVRARVTEYLTNSWNGSSSYRDADIDALVRRVVPAVQAGQRTVAQLTNTYLMQVRVAVGRAAAPQRLNMEEVSGSALRGVDMQEEYRRPAVTLYSALAGGESIETARSRGLVRLVGLAMTDLQLAKTHTVASLGVVTFRRTLSGSENCALCAIASTQRYYRGDLLPIHPGCDCGIAEVFSDSDPGQIVDSETLEMVHAEAQRFTGASDRGARELGLGKTDSKGRAISDYTDLIVTNTHGEYGPTLAWRAQKFTKKSDL